MMSQLRAFIVDDHPMVREGLANLLQGAGIIVAGEADGIRQALDHPALMQSQLVLVDLSLGEESGLALIRHLRDLALPVLVYSMHERADIIRQALEAGASGYVTKREASHALVEAIRTIAAGQCFLSSRVEKALGTATSMETLTGQQQQVYRLMGQGLSNDEMARQLGISVRTVESYAVRIMNKLNLQSMKELRQQAIRDAASHLPQ